MLISFAGFDFAGKDTAYEAIKDIEYELPFIAIKRIANADRLKEICLKVFGTHDNMKGTGAEDYYRMILTHCSDVIKIATEDPCYFPKYLFKKHTETLLSKEYLYVLTDGRYLDEINFFINEFAKHGKHKLYIPCIITRPAFPPTKYAREHHDFYKFPAFECKFVNEDLKEFCSLIQEMMFHKFGKVSLK